MSASSDVTATTRESSPTSVDPAPAGTVAAPAGSSKAAAAAAAAARTGAPRPGQPRKVRLTVARVDPWSTMKLSFLLSVALGVATVIAVMVLWLALSGMGVFDDVNRVLGQLTGEDGKAQIDILDFIGFPKMVSLSIVIAVINVILMTAIATLSAFLYNVSASLVGGLHLTLTDD